ncbi:Rgl1p NDAI_0E02940 [Naumovozyma dairenensis CBS 421]|uniref:Arrestin C-terminal-like domain-containing protein n=1 Tax=Naumovozyma dairenensis (strain ATCC 10597 / BCRC 20456 / CBS 421 / NBRC 0211 / NRRL Y-12639) TaxID=1071378 RepID=G0WBJ1_NAUDC|nr:hypothetical protein NDAI_0E02940 [Naumovozyma dairenensis CBS 421]CCD25111.1 hypothetical protein NDAI_0E02940 [Naumovozyma dairenensis CBS 421]
MFHHSHSTSRYVHTRPIISLKPSYNSVIRGCPGISDTLPRIECQLQIRSNNGKLFRIEKIEVTLKTIESLITTTSNNVRSLTKSKLKSKNEKHNTHYKKNILISEKDLIGIDIPLTIGLPDDIKETNYNKEFGKCITVLECNVSYIGNDNASGSTSAKIESFSQIINVERYVYIPSKRLFPPITKKVSSPDKRLLISYSIENPCLSIDDLLKLEIEIKPDLFQESTHNSPHIPNDNDRIFNKRKTKIKSVTFRLKEFLEVHNPEFPSDETKENILKEVSTPVNQVVTNNGITFKTNVRVCSKDSLFKNFESTMQEPAFLFKLPPEHSIPFIKQGTLQNQTTRQINTKLLQNKTNDVPIQYHNSITTMGTLFSIFHSLEMKFKLGNGKSFQLHQRLDIARWPVSQVKYIEQIIQKEKQTANYAKQFYNNFGSIKRNKHSGNLEYPPLPPVVYYPDAETFDKFGIIYDSTSDNEYVTSKARLPRRIAVIE